MPLATDDLSFGATDASESNPPAGSDSDADFFGDDGGFDLSLLTDNDFVEQLGSIYTDYQCTQSYFYNSGILQLPVAADSQDGTQACEFVQVAAPYGQRVVNWTTEREGLTPEIPDPFKDINANEVLLRAVVTSTAPVPMILGNAYSYQMNGTYTYGSTNPWRPGASNGGLLGGGFLPIGKLTPIVKSDGTSKDTNVFPTDRRCVQGIVEPADTDEDNDQDQVSSAANDASLAAAGIAGGAMAHIF
jgi:hypothetical protein